jgi:hypothetical protein
MSQENHEARIADLEKAVRLLLELHQQDQKIILGMIQSAHIQGNNVASIGKFLMETHPECSTPEIVGLFHKADTDGEFAQEKIDELKKLIACMSESPTNDAARESGTDSANGDSLHADVLTPKPKRTK